MHFSYFLSALILPRLLSSHFLFWEEAKSSCVISLHPPTYISLKDPIESGISAVSQSKPLILQLSSKLLSCFVIP